MKELEWTWKKKNGLLAAGEDPNQNFPDRDNQIRIFIEQIRKLDQDALLNRLAGLLDRLKDRDQLV